jgi:spore coat polysaccharide biosynthesis protein SpsF (cytidylyltransferase family)
MASNKEVKNRETINIALDETKSTVRKTTDEAVKEIPRFTKAVNEYQQETIQASKDIADSFLDSQKEVIHSMQSLWVPYIENVQNSYLSYWGSPQRVTENYARAVSNITDNTIVATRLANNNLFASMNAWKNSIEHARDNAKEFSRLNANVANTFENVARENLRDFSREGRQ